MKQIIKRTAETAMDLLIILVLVISVAVIIISAGSRKNGVPNMLGKAYFSIRTDSMEPTIQVGDMIISRISGNGEEYEIGDVVTFGQMVDGNRIFNTHRIVDKESEDGEIYYTTRGDNAAGQDPQKLVSGDIVAKWEGSRLKGFGKVMDFLRSKEGFFFCLILPVGLIFLFYLYSFIKNLALYNRDKAVEAARAATDEIRAEALAQARAEVKAETNAKTSVKTSEEEAMGLSEEQKKQIIAEYLAKQTVRSAG